MIVIGIDPGLSGAIVLLGPLGHGYEANTVISVTDMPTHTLERNGKMRREVDGVGLFQFLSGLRDIDHVFLEQSWSRLNDSAANAFAFGKCYGIVIGVLSCLSLPLTLIPPQRWKKKLAVPAAKDGARARASQLLPSAAGHWKRVKDDGRAEAALIALYGASTLAVTNDKDTGR